MTHPLTSNIEVILLLTFLYVYLCFTNCVSYVFFYFGWCIEEDLPLWAGECLLSGGECGVIGWRLARFDWLAVSRAH